MSAPGQITLDATPLRGTLQAISSKSHAHRLLIAAALTEGDRQLLIGCNTAGADILATVDCLEQLGARIEQTRDGFLVRRGIAQSASPIAPTNLQGATAAPICLDCRESGSTARFLLPVAGAISHLLTQKGAPAPTFLFTGSGRLPNRPFDPICAAMAQHGCRFDQACLPLVMTGALQPGEFLLPGNSSSQYLTGLLLALPLLEGDSCIRLTTPLESAGYVALTLQVLADAGIAVYQKQYTGADGTSRLLFEIPGRQAYQPGEAGVANGHLGQEATAHDRKEHCTAPDPSHPSPILCPVEGDWSNSAFFLVGAALNKGSQVTLTGLSQTVSSADRHTAQGDAAIAELLRQAGALVCETADAVTVTGNHLSPFSVSLREIPDLAPVLAVLAAGARGVSTLTDGARLRLKESDRLITVCNLIVELGGQAEIAGDDLIIYGNGTLAGGTVDSQNDHRIAMAAAVAALICKQPVILTNPGACSKSYPEFFAHWQRLQNK